MSNDTYDPEMGQMLFGQPHQEYKASDLVLAVIRFVEERLARAYWNVHQQSMRPCDNSGDRFDCDTFSIHAYSWNEDEDQQFNFRWRDFRVSWYKYAGRGSSMNRELSPNEVSDMLLECLSAIDDWYEENKTEEDF